MAKGIGSTDLLIAIGKGVGFVSLLGAMAIGAYFYAESIKSVTPGITTGAATPKVTVNVMGVKNDLVVFGNLERQNFASNGKYASLEELRSAGNYLPENRGPFQYTAEIGEQSFRITATYTGPPQPGVPQRLSIDESMQVSSE